MVDSIEKKVTEEERGDVHWNDFISLLSTIRFLKMPSKELLLDPWTEETDTPQKKYPTRNFLRWLTLVIVASFCFSFASPSTTNLAASKVWTIVRDLSGPPLDPEERALKLLSRQPIIGEFR